MLKKISNSFGFVSNSKTLYTPTQFETNFTLVDYIGHNFFKKGDCKKFVQKE